MSVKKLYLSMLAMLFFECNIADEDRCLNGYTWDDALNGCLKNADDKGTDSQTDFPTDTEPEITMDAGSDAGVDTEVVALPEGYGEPCTATGNECVSYEEANYCAYNPMEPEAGGVCTIKDCVPGGCPQGSLCCDCFSVLVTCVPKESAPEAEAQGCTCI